MGRGTSSAARSFRMGLCVVDWHTRPRACGSREPAQLAPPTATHRISPSPSQPDCHSDFLLCAVIAKFSFAVGARVDVPLAPFISHPTG
eukprot:4787320-Prymnesium_polylepis.3